jgi:hypothetical protein
VATASYPQAEVAGSPEQATIVEPETASAAQTKAVEKPKTPVPKTTSPTVSATTVSSGETSTGKTETGIRFRVQIAAGRRTVNIPQVFRKYQLEYNVVREQHEGWYKYSVGSFSEYKAARDYRVYLRTETPLDGAFVTAYNDGRRITVQEALLSLNQKWIK